MRADVQSYLSKKQQSTCITITCCSPLTLFLVNTNRHMQEENSYKLGILSWKVTGIHDSQGRTYMATCTTSCSTTGLFVRNFCAPLGPFILHAWWRRCCGYMHKSTSPISNDTRLSGSKEYSNCRDCPMPTSQTKCNTKNNYGILATCNDIIVTLLATCRFANASYFLKKSGLLIARSTIRLRDTLLRGLQNNSDHLGSFNVHPMHGTSILAFRPLQNAAGIERVTSAAWHHSHWDTAADNVGY